jgi:hypothetical protein
MEPASWVAGYASAKDLRWLASKILGRATLAHGPRQRQADAGTRRAYRTRGIDAVGGDSYVANDRVRISRRDDSTKEALMPTLLVVLVALVMLMSTVPAPAADDKPLSPQAQRMKDCSAQAKERALGGDARKTFMSDCLKGGSPGSASPASDTPGGTGAASEPSPPGTR